MSFHVDVKETHTHTLSILLEKLFLLLHQMKWVIYLDNPVLTTEQTVYWQMDF